VILSNVVFVSESFQASEKNALSSFLVVLIVIALMCSFVELILGKVKRNPERNDTKLEEVQPDILTVGSLESIKADKLPNSDCKNLGH
jgi:hypothetical protein